MFDYLANGQRVGRDRAVGLAGAAIEAAEGILNGMAGEGSILIEFRRGLPKAPHVYHIHIIRND